MTETQQQNEDIRLTIISVFDAEYERIHKLNWKPFLKKMDLLWNPPPKEEKVGHKDALAHSEAILPPKTSKQKRYIEEFRKCFNCTEMVPKKRLRCEACAKAWHNLGRDKREKLQVKVKCWDCEAMIPENQKRCAPCRKIHNPAAMRESQKALYRARRQYDVLGPSGAASSNADALLVVSDPQEIRTHPDVLVSVRGDLG